VRARVCMCVCAHVCTHVRTCMDQLALVNIIESCRGWPGGDYMPRMIDTYLKDEQCLMIVADDNAGNIDGIG